MISTTKPNAMKITPKMNLNHATSVHRLPCVEGYRCSMGRETEVCHPWEEMGEMVQYCSVGSLTLSQGHGTSGASPTDELQHGEYECWGGTISTLWTQRPLRRRATWLQSHVSVFRVGNVVSTDTSHHHGQTTNLMGRRAMRHSSSAIDPGGLARGGDGASAQQRKQTKISMHPEDYHSGSHLHLDAYHSSWFLLSPSDHEVTDQLTISSDDCV